MIIRIVCWDLNQVVYKDTIGFIHNASRPGIVSFLRHHYQEPMHPALIRLVHDMLFPRDPISELPDPFTWEFSAFAVGMVFTVICLWLLFELGHYIHSVRTGLWAAFFMAVQPYAVHYSINGLSETTYLFFVLLAILLTLKAIQTYKSLLFVAGVCSVFAFLTRKEAIILPIVIGCYLLISKNIPFTARLKWLSVFIFGIIITGCLYGAIGGRIYWLRGYSSYWQKVIQLFVSQSYSTDHFVLASIWMTKKYQIFYLALFAWVREAAFLPALLFFLFIFKRKMFQINTGWGILILFCLFHLLIVLTQCSISTLFVSRYLFPSTVIIFPIAALVMVTSLDRIAERKQETAHDSIISIVTSVVILLIFVPMITKRYFTYHRKGEKQAAQWLSQNSNRDSIIISDSKRAAFYSRRTFVPLSNYTIKNRIDYARKKGLSRCYFVIVFKKNKPDKFDRWQLYINKNNLKIEFFKDFYGPRDRLVLFKLKEEKN